MTLLLSSDDVESLASDEAVIDAVRRAFRLEAEGRTRLPVRLDVPSDHGFFRVMPAVLDGVMGCKIMTLVREKGTRYLVMLYDVESGGPLALLDADVLTKLRTAAVTALAAENLMTEPLDELGVLGSGFEARGHVRCFAERFTSLSRVAVYSRSGENRDGFARWCESALGLSVKVCDRPEDAVGSSHVALLATKSSEPVVDGAAFPAGAVVLSIGSTRPDLRELDDAAFARAAVLVMDAPGTVEVESGDVASALTGGAIGRDRCVGLADVVAGRELPASDGAGRDLRVFKSAGTALQDLALALAVYGRAQDEGRGQEIGELSRLKPFQT